MNNEIVTTVFLDITKFMSPLTGGILKFSRWEDSIDISFAREPMFTPIFTLHMSERQFQETITIMTYGDQGIKSFIDQESSLMVINIPRAEPNDG